MRTVLIWALLSVALAVPLGFAATSPLLQWREPVYIAAGFAGVIGLALMLLQPLLAGGILPGLPALRGRRVHRVVGGVLVLAVVVHVGGLWITSPPDVVDALLFMSPTPFAVWGVIAMWSVFAAALLALFRRRIGLGLRTWRRGHTALAAVTVIGSVVHAILIEGTMEAISKVMLGALVLIATATVIVRLRVWGLTRRGRDGAAG